MMLMDYTSIRGEYYPDYAKHSTWNLLHAYIDAQIQRLIDKYKGDGVQAITIFQYQCTNMIFLTREGTIDYFIKWCTKEEIQKSTTSTD